MKIVEQTASRMVLRQKSPGLTLFILLWASLFSGMPLIVIVGLIFNSGVRQLTCHRIEPSQINCQFQKSQVGGLLNTEPIRIPQIKAAELQQETRRNDDGDYLVYRSTLLTSERTFDLSDFSTDEQTNANWVSQINQFISSQQTELVLTHDNRWNLSKTIAPILFLSLFVIVGFSVVYAVVRSQTLILDKNLNRITYKVWTLLGTRRSDYPLGIIRQVELKEHTDSYGNKSYEPILVPDQAKRISFAHATNRQEALQIQAKIQDFLNLSAIRPDAPPADQPEEGTIIYTGQRGTYQTSGLTEIPLAAPSKVRQIDRQLTQLGFDWLGDLQISTLAQIPFYTYVHASKDLYAIVMVLRSDAITQKTKEVEPIISLDFLTHFFNGTLLITTTQKLVFQHLKSQKIQRWSYPTLDTTQLYQQHQQQVSTLHTQIGRTHRAKPDMSAIAALLDDYLTRQSQGIPLIKTLINAVTILSTAQPTR